MDADPFDDLFNLEDTYYEEGFRLGHADGLRQARVEARLFGIEKGFDKFVEMGRLQARARIWEAIVKGKDSSGGAVGQNARDQERNEADHRAAGGNARLEKHVDTLLALVDPSTLSTANTDDAVADFDDRLKRAQAKVKVIERLMGSERSAAPIKAADSKARNNANMEDFGL